MQIFNCCLQLINWANEATRRISAVSKGVESRRLAGREHTDEEERYEEAYLESLCLALGAWAPSEGLPGGPRASPGLVDEVLATLEEGVADSASLGITGISGDASVDPALSGFERILPASTSNLPSPISGDQGVDVFRSTLEARAAEAHYFMPPQTSGHAPAYKHEHSKRKRYRPKDAGEDEPGPSSKIPTLAPPARETIVQPLELPPQSVWEALPPASGDVSRFQIPSTDDLTQGVPPHEVPFPSYHAPPSSSVVPVTYWQPPSSEATSGTSDTSLTDWEKKHPYVRIPSKLPGVVPRPLNADIIFDRQGMQRHIFLLREVREILVNKPVLLREDAHYLVTLVEELANHMYHQMSTEITKVPPYKATYMLGRRFLLYDAIYSASIALEVNWPRQLWWKTLAEKVPTDVCVDEYGRHAHQYYVELLEDMVEALRLFKSGLRPPEEMIISIKRRLFGRDCTLYFFKYKCWDDWREDDKHS
ncbi:hypothetical protein ACSSS7_000723 [Eimeria intestinalis]